MKKTIVFIVIMALFSGCSKDSNEKSESEEASQSETESTESPSFENTATSIGNSVHIRSGASTDTEVVGVLNAGNKVGVLESSGTYEMVGKYYGKWLKVEMEDGTTGYVLSSFLKTPGDDLEKFHVFFDKFVEALQGQDMGALEKHIRFPLEYGMFFEGEGEMETLEKGNFFDKVLSGKPTYDISFNLADNGDILCYYGFEGVQYTMHFRPVHGDWKLVKLIASRC